MKRFLTLSTWVVAGTAATLLATTASFAGMADYNQLQQSVKSGLATLQITSPDLDNLTMAEVAQLSAIFDSTQSTVAKTAAANQVLTEAAKPTQAMAPSAPSAQTLATIKADLTKIGLGSQSVDNITAVQAQQLLDVLKGHKKNPDKLKQVVQKVIASFAAPAPAKT